MFLVVIQWYQSPMVHLPKWVCLHVIIVCTLLLHCEICLQKIPELWYDETIRNPDLKRAVFWLAWCHGLQGCQLNFAGLQIKIELKHCIYSFCVIST